MKKSSIPWSVKQFLGAIKKGNISFDYPIQRKGGQWDLLQKSELIHSITDDFPIPPFYSIQENGVYMVLDGKQRLTTIRDFVNNEFALHKDTPALDSTNYEEVIELSGKTYDELPEDVQFEILTRSLNLYKLDDATDEDIETMFYRLNNGTPLSKQQKAKAKIGIEWAEEIKFLTEHSLMEKAQFTEAQIRKADDETAIFQTMMLLDPNHELKSVSANHVFDYVSEFKDSKDEKMAIAKRVEEAMAYLDEAIDTKEKLLLKKVNFPSLLITALEAKESGVHPLEFADWMEEFKKALKEKSDIPTDYKEFGGQGSIKRDKALGRVSSMKAHMSQFINSGTKEEESQEKEIEQEA